MRWTRGNDTDRSTRRRRDGGAEDQEGDEALQGGRRQPRVGGGGWIRPLQDQARAGRARSPLTRGGRIAEDQLPSGPCPVRPRQEEGQGRGPDGAGGGAGG